MVLSMDKFGNVSGSPPCQIIVIGVLSIKACFLANKMDDSKVWDEIIFLVALSVSDR